MASQQLFVELRIPVSIDEGSTKVDPATMQKWIDRFINVDKENLFERLCFAGESFRDTLHDVLTQAQRNCAGDDNPSYVSVNGRIQIQVDDKTGVEKPEQIEAEDLKKSMRTILPS
jgi:hypothetical protein